MRSSFIFSALLVSLTFATSAFAQEEEEGTASASATVKTPAAPAATATASTTTADDGTTDHDKVVGKVGVGYLGQLDVPLGPGGTLPTQIVGVRYWLQQNLAIVGGLGFFTGSSKTTTKTGGNTVENEGPAATAVSLKGGAAIALATGKHYTFVIEPQAVLGFSTQTVKGTGGAPDTDNSGFRLAIGATAGAEVQFGFIGIPELSLIASVGAAFNTQSGTTKVADNEQSASQTSLATFTLANPWNIFSGNVAAVYYF